MCPGSEAFIFTKGHQDHEHRCHGKRGPGGDASEGKKLPFHKIAPTILGKLGQRCSLAFKGLLSKESHTARIHTTRTS